MASSFVKDCVKAMNVYRSSHQVSPLTHNKELTAIAQSWADHLAASGSLSHNPKASYRGENLGENCAMRYSSDRQDYTGQHVVDQWYSEVERYDFNRHSGPKTGHFTQMVWKSSRDVGIGHAQSRDGKLFVVANFFPAGNVIGHNAENVFGPRDGKVVLPTKPDSDAAKPVKGKESGGGGGESVKREVQTETIGRGPNAVTRTTIIETRTTRDGRTQTTTTVNETKGSSDTFNDAALQSKMTSVSLSDQDRVSKQASQTSPDLVQFANDVLRRHNVHRKQHGSVDSLTLNGELTSMSQQWAEHLASINSLKHSNIKYEGQPVGENVAAKSGTTDTDYSGQEVVDQWYSEQAKFDYREPEGNSGAGHFSQVVWKSSRQLGVGKAKTLDGRQVFVVCMYFPAGNYVGRYKENVLPPK